MSTQKISTETQSDALKIAKATQKPSQTKEQTKLIAQGIEKGIAEYKKQQKQKAREQDKLRKKQLKQKNNSDNQKSTSDADIPTKPSTGIYKLSLMVSWAIFITYIAVQHYY